MYVRLYLYIYLSGFGLQVCSVRLVTETIKSTFGISLKER